MIRIGIDTGGTFTDIAAIDMDTGELLAKGKSPTTKEDLVIGISKAIELIPKDILEKADSLSLSTTLATNACVENKGGRAKLVLIGCSDDAFKRATADCDYGIDKDMVLCVDNHGSYDGSRVDMPDWDRVITENEDFFSDAEALSISELYSFNNGAACEKRAKTVFMERLHLPVVAATEIANELNIMKRGATAMLNARLLPVIEEFINAVEEAAREKGLTAQSFAVRSDCSLMSHAETSKRPVETILSGPAASVIGGYRAFKGDALIIDMGGTTTDISIVKSGFPKMSQEIKIAGWSTQVKGVFVETFPLGGDSRVFCENGSLVLGEKRAVPICHAAAKWPQIKDTLRGLGYIDVAKGFNEFLCLVKMPRDLSAYTEGERRLLRALENEPRIIDSFSLQEGISKFRLESDRLEREGYIIRAAITPTDIMHIKGDFSKFDTEASRLALGLFRNLEKYSKLSDDEMGDIIYDLVCKKLYQCIVRVLLEDSYPKLFIDGVGEQTGALFDALWSKDSSSKGGSQGLLGLDISCDASLVGVGAPIHVFLPAAARALNTEYIIPENAHVANAVGAVFADITARVRVDINNISGEYLVHAPDGMKRFGDEEEAQKYAISVSEAAAECEARKRGALGGLRTESRICATDIMSKGGGLVKVGMFAEAISRSL